ncbi:MAG: 4Fe-4S dicluster domain-containing protein [Oryzomonas sp.]|uniref:4Fe-4S dicluster domain-containing protein n=1 Tax=Oryzomonas sp. TaxID=2855186 RepID=UPI00284A660B|nr:4Fe-4S dicluster domain-containing protein [Oryzomonas sp.]MDR3579827.1 4Fe-4S dicluster domain-containing protein [Oryzomonas sp.]
MARNLLKRDSISFFLEILATFGKLHGPILTDDGVLAFRPLGSGNDLLLEYSRTLVPPKKYLLPPRDAVLFFAPDEWYHQLAAAVPETILVGLHPCDLQGIAYLDKVFLGDRIDPLYRARRTALTLIGLSCEPDENCFCGDLSATETHGCDLFMHQSPGGFNLKDNTPKGTAILDRLTPILAEGKSLPAVSRTCDMAAAIQLASVRSETHGESALWDEFAERCLSCGACSLCCPTCYCFDIREYGALDGESTVRLREWDNCLFKDHGEVAGGFNFRKSRQERFQYRYRHKYLGFGPTRGIASCVGCGRCRAVCPVGIDLLELFKERQDEKQP